MKKNFLLLLCTIIISTVLSAQISKGSIWLGGNIGFWNTKNQTGETFKNSYYSVSPAIGIAFKENSILGLDFNYDRTKFKTENTDQSITNYGVNVFERQYWTILKRFYAFGHFRAGYSEEERESQFQASKEEVDGWKVGIGAGPGVSFELSRRFQLETLLTDLFFLNYGKSKTTNTDTNGTRSHESQSMSGGINFDNSANLTLGIRFLLKK